MTFKKIILVASFFLSAQAFCQTSTGGYNGTGTASTTEATLPAHQCSSVIFQNDPSSTTNLKAGYISGSALVIVPGSSVTLKVYNSSVVAYKAVSGTPTYNWACGN